LKKTTFSPYTGTLITTNPPFFVILLISSIAFSVPNRSNLSPYLPGPICSRTQSEEIHSIELFLKGSSVAEDLMNVRF
jgi:hypothetical protein